VRNKARQNNGSEKTCGTFVKGFAPAKTSTKTSMTQMELLRAQVMGRYKQMKKASAPKRGFACNL
jgi:hypothetical protein